MILFTIVLGISTFLGVFVTMDEDIVLGVLAFIASFLIAMIIATAASIIISDVSGNSYIAEEIAIDPSVEFNDGYFYYQGSGDLSQVDKVFAGSTKLAEGEGRLVTKKHGIESPWLFNWLDSEEHILHVEEVEWK